MGPRRTHKKSRDGCQTCKRRRVKCDESGPPCSNCIARQLECTYTAPPRPKTADDKHSENGIDDSMETLNSPVSVAATIDANARRLSELELMHTFSTETYRSLMGNKDIANDTMYWQTYVPKLALKYDFLLNGILSIAALHMSISADAQDSMSYVHAALDYQNAALASFTGELGRISEDNASAVFCFSVINFILSIALPSWSPEICNDTTTLRSTLGHIRLIHGMKSLVQYSRDWLLKNPYPTFNDNLNVTGKIDNINPTTVKALNTLKIIIRQAKEADSRESDESESQDAFLAMIDEPVAWLIECYNRFDGGEHNACLTWPASLSEQFLHQIEQLDPLALLVLVTWTPMLHALADVAWWARNCGRSLAGELTALLACSDPSWATIVVWAREQVGIPGVPVPSPVTILPP